MKVLILGATGMLGHKLYQRLSRDFDTFATVRSSPASLVPCGIFDLSHICEGVDAMEFDSLATAIQRVRPSVVVNCIGVIKQHPLSKDPITSLTINSLLPHRLAALGVQEGFRTIHISTDCVFSGKKGGYVEDDPSDAEDLYGKTKFLGEVACPGALTLRTSIIGRELRTSSGLVDWFLTQKEPSVKGFTQAIFSGLTTIELSNVIANIIAKHPELTGLYQVSSEPINKHELLGLVKEAYGRRCVRILPDDEFAIDRSLDSTLFRSAVGYQPPAWPQMIEQMAADPIPYDSWR